MAPSKYRDSHRNEEMSPENHGLLMPTSQEAPAQLAPKKRRRPEEVPRRVLSRRRSISTNKCSRRRTPQSSDSVMIPVEH